MIFGCIKLFKFLRNNSNYEYCKIKTCFSDLQYSVKESLKEKKNIAIFLFLKVFHIVGHLVYWGKATIIYPLCETNVYVLSPVANTYT